MGRASLLALLAAAAALLAAATATPNHTEWSDEPEFGSLKLCPPGGRSFMMAWNLACEMKKRRRKRAVGGSVASREQSYWDSRPSPIAKRAGLSTGSESRPATLEEIMKICCMIGCEIRDLLPYCDPFGSWNS